MRALSILVLLAVVALSGCESDCEKAARISCRTQEVGWLCRLIPRWTGMQSYQCREDQPKHDRCYARVLFECARTR